MKADPLKFCLQTCPLIFIKYKSFASAEYQISLRKQNHVKLALDFEKMAYQSKQEFRENGLSG
jgi:hypothetical protein